MHRIIRLWPVAGLIAVLSVIAMASPVSAQYAGNERGFVVSPLRVPAGSDLSGLGFGCSGASTVTITIQGEPGIFTTVVAEDDGTYSFGGIPISAALVIGDTYSAVASCDGVFETADFTVICANGNEPDSNADCPIPTTTTIANGDGSIRDPLAFTGASTLNLLQFSATLVGVGVLFILLGRRRDRDSDSDRESAQIH